MKATIIDTYEQFVIVEDVVGDHYALECDSKEDTNWFEVLSETEVDRDEVIRLRGHWLNVDWEEVMS